MAEFKRFEEIEAWQKARELTRRVYQFSNQGEFVNDFALRNQIRKSCISIMSNIAEGFERQGNAEFVQFLLIAKGSAGEARTQLYIALDQGYISDSTFEDLFKLVMEICRMLGGLVKYLQASDKKGSRFKD